MDKLPSKLEPSEAMDNEALLEQDQYVRRPSWRDYLSRYGQLFLTLALAAALFWSLAMNPRNHEQDNPPPPPPTTPSRPLPFNYDPSLDDDAPSFFKNLFKSSIPKDLTTPITYVDDITNESITLNGKPVWTKPLGKQILILDLDTRPYDDEDKLLYDGPVAWRDLERSSAGLLNHYMYSLLHGYDYKFIRPQLPEDRFASWTKPGTIAAELLSNKYRFVVFSDADALWNHPEIPLEALLNHWNVSTRTSLCVSEDPPQYRDDRGRAGLNTGFMIAQNSPRTIQILNAWSDCPDGALWPECEMYKNVRVFEQTAFNKYVRNTFNRREDIKPLPCNETDGYRGSPDNCTGQLIRHFWREKDKIKSGVAGPLMRMLGYRMNELRDYFVGHRGELYIEEER